MKLLVVDGNSIVNRSFYGIRPLTTKEGIHTNAIYGFLTTMLRIQQDEKPDGVAIAFDMRAPTFRHKMYDGYKGTRKGMPPELAEQMPLLKELLTYLGYNLVECEGYEADDILGTLSKKCDDTGNTCVIATGDRDSLQLVNANTTVRYASTKAGQPEVVMFDVDKIHEKYGVEPAQLIDIKAIMGDSSDNIPGIKGIGEKGAMQLIQSYGSLKYIYDNLDSIEVKPAMLKKLTEGKDSAFMSYELGKICTEAPIDTELSNYEMKECDKVKAADMMKHLELFRLIERMNLADVEEVKEDEQETVEHKSRLADEDEFIKLAEKQGFCDFLCTDINGEKPYIIFDCSDEIVAAEATVSLLEKLFSLGIKLCTHNVKPIYKLMDKSNIRPQEYANDSMLCAYVLNPSLSGYDLDKLYAVYEVNTVSVDTSALPEELKNADEIKNATCFRTLREKLCAEIEQNGQQKLLEQIELPLAYVLARMENVGFDVDEDGIKSYGSMIEERLNEYTELVYELSGEKFNINSPKQLGVVLFEKMGLPHGKKTKSGYSTNADVLEKLRADYPIVDAVLNYRALAKLKSTYCEGLLKEIAADGRIHSSFNQAETRTGRISSTEPNLQNIPVRTELGREMRRFFIASDGNVLVDADYSQIELRVLAHMADDKNMIEGFKSGNDIHTITASQVFNMPEPMVTPLMRSRAKAVNFGIVYGIGAFSLSQDIGVTRKEAERYINAYLEHYSGVRDYLDKLINDATEKGYAETMFGRRRYLPELQASNFNLRSFGQRVARNMPIQGTAADIIKLAMINVDQRLTEEGLKARLILQVHDELIVEAPENEKDRVLVLLKEEMQNAVHLSVELTADASFGKTWYNAKG